MRAGAFVAAKLPAPVTRAGAEAAGVVIAHTPGARSQRAQVARHLRRVCGPGLRGVALQRRVDATYASHARYWAESLRLPSLTADRIMAGFDPGAIEHVDTALANGTGAILALPHLGGWEWGGLWLILTGHPLTVIVERLTDANTFDWLSRWRVQLGMEVVPTGPGAGRAALAALRSNRVVCLLCDRLVGDVPGVEVEFFGERTSIPAGPVTLGIRTGAPVIPTAVYFGSRTDEHVAVLRPPLVLRREGRLRDDVAASSQVLAHELEYLIRRAPTQWHLFQPNWPSDYGARVGQQRDPRRGAVAEVACR
jgi:phosphatidylinositol dimannoside acyltransferase